MTILPDPNPFHTAFAAFMAPRQAKLRADGEAANARPVAPKPAPRNLAELQADLAAALIGFDPAWQMADDYGAFSAGRRQHGRIESLRVEIARAEAVAS